MAPADASHRQPEPAKRAVSLDRFDGVGRAAWRISTCWRQDARRPQLPKPDRPNEQPLHWQAFPQARTRSARIAMKSRARPAVRPINTWSAPAIPQLSSSSRTISRSRRFKRLRTTDPPIFLVTVKPARRPPLSSRRLTSRMKPGVTTLAPRLAARKSARFFIVGGGDPIAATDKVRPTASCGRARGGPAKCCDHQRWPYATETHGGGREQAWRAEMCAS